MSAAPVLTPLPRVVEFDSEDERYEVIDGVRVELPPMSANASVAASRLATLINMSAMPNGHGEAYPEVLFKLPIRGKDRERRPDVAFVPYSRWPRSRPVPNTSAWDVLPSVCVEVVSPTDKAEPAREKLADYLAAGVELVWMIYPQIQLVDVWTPAGGARVLRKSDVLDGGTVIPGLSISLADLFVGEPSSPRPNGD